MSRSPGGPSPALLFVFAAASGVAVANVYYAQSLVDVIADDIGLGRAAAGVVVTVAQAGYAVGLILLVPLGDVVGRRRLIAAQGMILGVAALVVAASASPSLLLPAMGVVGMFAVVTQVIVAHAASVARPGRRGQVVGHVTSGVVVGIVAARTLAGPLTQVASWRAVYIASALLTIATTGLLVRALPDDRSAGAVRYRRVVGSALGLIADPKVRRRAVLALLVFAASSVMWTALALTLSDPPHSFSRARIGAFGLVGLAGAVMARLAGRSADRGRGEWMTGASLALLVVAWLPAALLNWSLWPFGVGLLAIEVAVQGVHVTSLSMLQQTRPDTGSSVIAVYMVFYAVGTAAGSAAATATYAASGWASVCVLGAALAGSAILVWVAGLRQAAALLVARA